VKCFAANANSLLSRLTGLGVPRPTWALAARPHDILNIRRLTHVFCLGPYRRPPTAVVAEAFIRPFNTRETICMPDGYFYISQGGYVLPVHLSVCLLSGLLKKLLIKS